jgi:hypothetical protein
MLTGPAKVAALAGVGGLAGGAAIGALGGRLIKPVHADTANSANVEPGQLDE